CCTTWTACGNSVPRAAAAPASARCSARPKAATPRTASSASVAGSGGGPLPVLQQELREEVADVDQRRLRQQNVIRAVGSLRRNAVDVDRLGVVAGEAIPKAVVLRERLHRRARQTILAAQKRELVIR